MIRSTTYIRATALDFGADPSGTNDSAAAIQQALDAFPITNPALPRGGDVLVPRGDYLVDANLYIRRGLVLRGESGWGWFGGTVLRFTAGHGLIVCGAPEHSVNGLGRGDWSVIRDLCLLGSGGSSHGIDMRTKAGVERVWIRGFGKNGVNIDTSQPTPPGAEHNYNANCWSVQMCRIDQCGGHGLFVKGQDANAGEGRLVDCSENQGWGIYDDSFLGNTYTACHTADNELGGYKAGGLNSHTVLVGCYCEDSQGPDHKGHNEISPPALVLGGCMTSMPPGCPFIESTQEGMRSHQGLLLSWPVTLPDGSQDVIELRLGNRPNDRKVLSFGSRNTGAKDYALVFDPVDKEWVFLFNDVTPVMGVAGHGITKPGVAPGDLMIYLSFLLGLGADRIRVTADSFAQDNPATQGVKTP